MELATNKTLLSLFKATPFSRQVVMRASPASQATIQPTAAYRLQTNPRTQRTPASSTRTTSQAVPTLPPLAGRGFHLTPRSTNPSKQFSSTFPTTPSRIPVAAASRTTFRAHPGRMPRSGSGRVNMDRYTNLMSSMRRHRTLAKAVDCTTELGGVSREC